MTLKALLQRIVCCASQHVLKLTSERTISWQQLYLSTSQLRIFEMPFIIAHAVFIDQVNVIRETLKGDICIRYPIDRLLRLSWSYSHGFYIYGKLL